MFMTWIFDMFVVEQFVRSKVQHVKVAVRTMALYSDSQEHVNCYKTIIYHEIINVHTKVIIM